MKKNNMTILIYVIFNYTFPFIIVYCWETIQKGHVEWNTFLYKVASIYLIDFIFDYVIKGYKSYIKK